MYEVFSVVIPIFGIIFLGYIAGRNGTLGDPCAASSVINSYIYYFCMPAFLFLAMSRVDGEFNRDYILTYAVSLLFTAGIAGIISHTIFKRSNKELILSMMASAYSNSAYLGIPIMQLAYGTLLPVVSVTAFQVGLITPIALTALSMYSTGIDTPNFQGPWARPLFVFRRALGVAIQNPIVVASIGGVLVGANQIAVPPVLNKFLELLGQGGMSGALFVLGLSLNNIKGVTIKRSEVVFLSSLSLIGLPLVAYVSGKYIFDLELEQLRAVVLMAAMPTAMNIFVFAKKHQSFVAETAVLVVVTLIGSFFTLSALLYWFRI